MLDLNIFLMLLMVKSLPLNDGTRQKRCLESKHMGLKMIPWLYFGTIEMLEENSLEHLIYWFKDFLDKIGHDKAKLVMHTDPNDPHGQDLYSVLEELGLDRRSSIDFCAKTTKPEMLAKLYAGADLTVNISDAEGFGLATLESLSCGTPIMVTMTGGLQEQVTDGEGNWFGMGIQPSSKAIIGSQQVPWIYEDRISGKKIS